MRLRSHRGARWRLPLAALLLALAGLARGAELEVRVAPVFNGSPLALDAIKYGLADGTPVSVTRLSMILGGFALQRQDGTWLELPAQYAWMDAGARRMSVTLHDVPAARYAALRFAVGPDAEANDGPPDRYPADHPLNANLNGLHWSWLGGYIFLAVEGSYRRVLRDVSGYSYHLARNPNRAFVTTPAPVDLSGGLPAAVLLEMDLSALLGRLSPARDGDSTHSRDGDVVARALRDNLQQAFCLKGIAGAAPPSLAAKPARPLYMPATYTAYPMRIASGFPIPDLPADNPLLVERVELGRRLFREPRLSRDGLLSCSRCHREEDALADDRRLSVGVEGRSGTRHAMPLTNLAWKSSYFWDGRAPTLRAQALMPIQDHLEMDENLSNAVTRLQSDGEYRALFTRAFGSPSVTAEKIGLAIENFLLTVTSFDSKFDQARRGEAELTAQEQRGMNLFFTENDPRTGQHGADCFHCHGGPLFSDHAFHDNGLGESADPGRYKVTHAEQDRGKFATPSLRNVALVGPYMHDGRFNTLEEAVEHYSTGVKRTPNLDPNLARHPPPGLPLSADDKAALVAFLKTLTDPRFDRPPGPFAGLGP